MPYVNIKITREGAKAEQKAALIKGVTDLLANILDKDLATTFVVIDEVEMEDWGVGIFPSRSIAESSASEREASMASRRRSRGAWTSRFQSSRRPWQALPAAHWPPSAAPEASA